MERERRKAEKQKKFDAKKAKTTPAPAESKTKEKKAKQESSKEEPLPDFKWEMGSGEKKRRLVFVRFITFLELFFARFRVLSCTHTITFPCPTFKNYDITFHSLGNFRYLSMIV